MVSQTALRYDEQDWQPRPTLSGAEYTSDGVYDEERERIWWGDWVCVGREEELARPGDYIVRDLAGESVFITRERGRRAPRFLQRVQPPRHEVPGRRAGQRPCAQGVHVPVSRAGSIGLDGSLIGTPNVKENERFERRDYPLHGFAVETFGGFIFVNLTRDTPRPLLEQMNEGAESLVDVRPVQAR